MSAPRSESGYLASVSWVVTNTLPPTLSEMRPRTPVLFLNDICEVLSGEVARGGDDDSAGRGTGTGSDRGGVPVKRRL